MPVNKNARLRYRIIDACLTNPLKYKFLSAKFYETAKEGFNILTHYKDCHKTLPGEDT
jgi:hypothetical protein